MDRRWAGGDGGDAETATERAPRVAGDRSGSGGWPPERSVTDGLCGVVGASRLFTGATTACGRPSTGGSVAGGSGGRGFGLRGGSL